MNREHNLTINTVAASRGQRVTNNANDSSSDNEIEEKENRIIATVEGQASVEKGEPLTLLDDSNSYWWLVKVLRNEEVGYIPAETVETPFEKLARLNKHRNINISSSQNLKYEEEGDDEIEFDEYYEESKDSNDSKEQKDQVEVESLDEQEEQEEQITEKRESMDSVLTSSSTNTITQDNAVTMQTSGATPGDEQQQQKITAGNSQPMEGDNNSFIEQTNYYSRSSPNENQESNDIQPTAQPMNPPTHSSENIFDQSSETIKMSLTPALGSDFMDFSDDEDYEPKQKTGSKFFGKNDNDSSKKKPKNNKKDDDSPRQSTGKSVSQDPLVMNNVQSYQTKPLTYQQQITNQPQSNIQSPAYGRQQQQPSPPLQSTNALTQSPTQIPSPQQSVKQSPTTRQQSGQSPTQIPSTKSSPTQSDQSPTSTSRQQFRTSQSKRLSNPSGSAYSVVRIFAGQNISTKHEYKIVLLSQVTNTISLIKQALKRFKLDNEENWDEYYVTIKESDREPHILLSHEYPLEIFETLTSSYLTPLPTVKRASISSVSSNFSDLSSHEAISKLLFRDDKNLVCLYINKKSKTDIKTNSMEMRFRVRVLAYSDDLPAHLRHKGTIPRVSMSVPKHLVEKAARRRSREEGKPREKAVSVTGKNSIGQIVEKSMSKFGITDGVVDDGKPILESDDGKPRYYLTMIVNGDEVYLQPETNVMSVYKAPPDLRHFSIDSVDSNASAFDYHPDEPIFVLRLLRPEDRQKRAMPQSATEDIKRYTQNVNIAQTLIDDKSIPFSPQLVVESAVEGTVTVTENVGENDQLSRKQLIEQQREYSRAKQKSILSARKNEEQGVDIITSIGAIRSSRIFGAKVRYSFISVDGEEVDISDLIEDVWGDDDLMNIQDASSNSNSKLRNELTYPEKGDVTSVENKRKSRTAEVDILENIVNDGDDENETETIEQRINRVIQKVKAGQYGMSELPSITSAMRTKNTESQTHMQGENERQPSPVQSNNKKSSVGSNDSSFEPDAKLVQNEIPARDSTLKQKSSDELLNDPKERPESDLNNADLERPASSISNQSASTINSLESITPLGELFPTTNLQRAPSATPTSTTENDWVMSDEFGLQELLVLVRSGVNMLEIKERRRSGWSMNDDPDKILEQIKPSDILDDIKAVFAGVNDELDKLESELDQIMSDAVRVF
ncbi:18306_t:CDS:10 [Acaulospora morrowiae]|uniref:18306_t:CDS:1 n=1 Tax=Acaulospora morrowiae TaxID=94023 RepID=A0A9N9FCR7_9GLOM|nr:18306_t:CDS:10 [Acaulospora morrowiae]